MNDRATTSRLAARRPTRLAPLLLLATMPLAACQAAGGEQGSQGAIAGSTVGGPFSLIDQDGKRVRDTDFNGRASRVRQFGRVPGGPAGDRRLKKFEGEDQARCSRSSSPSIPSATRRGDEGICLAAFHPRLIGLTGTPEQIAGRQEAHGVYARSRRPKAALSDYMVNHSRIPAVRAEGRADRDPAARAGRRGDRRRAEALGAMTDRFWEKPLEELSRAEWESLCDGCGKCCLHKVEDEATGEVHRPTSPASCSTAQRPLQQLSRPQGLRARLRPPHQRQGGKARLAPSTCAYRLRAEGKPLPDWHHLSAATGERARGGQSVRGWTISEEEAGDLEHHLIDREL
jgi:uncharacterized cysteine cluster protein YcgN (CxxCxxCC family)